MDPTSPPVGRLDLEADQPASQMGSNSAGLLVGHPASRPASQNTSHLAKRQLSYAEVRQRRDAGKKGRRRRWQMRSALSAIGVAASAASIVGSHKAGESPQNRAAFKDSLQHPDRAAQRARAGVTATTRVRRGDVQDAFEAARRSVVASDARSSVQRTRDASRGPGWKGRAKTFVTEPREPSTVARNAGRAATASLAGAWRQEYRRALPPDVYRRRKRSTKQMAELAQRHRATLTKIASQPSSKQPSTMDTHPASLMVGKVDGGPASLHVNGPADISVAVIPPLKRSKRRVRKTERWAAGSPNGKGGKFKPVGARSATGRRPGFDERTALNDALRHQAIYGGIAQAGGAFSRSGVGRKGKLRPGPTIEVSVGLGGREKGIKVRRRKANYRPGKRSVLFERPGWELGVDSTGGVSRSVSLRVSPFGKTVAAISLAEHPAWQPSSKLPSPQAAHLAIEPVEKHPGHTDQSIHGRRHFQDPGRRTVGRKPANRGSRNRQGHDAAGRYTARSRKRDRTRALQLAAALGIATAAHRGIKQEQRNAQQDAEIKTLREAVRTADAREARRAAARSSVAQAKRVKAAAATARHGVSAEGRQQRGRTKARERMTSEVNRDLDNRFRDIIERNDWPDWPS